MIDSALLVFAVFLKAYFSGQDSIVSDQPNIEPFRTPIFGTKMCSRGTYSVRAFCMYIYIRTKVGKG